jgi:hypothetical protein
MGFLKYFKARDTLEWVLRIGVFGTFMGHGIWALSIKQSWFKYFTGIGIAESSIPMLLILIGIMDITVSLFVLFKPYRFILVWATFWALATALIRPITAGFFTIEFADFIERAANFMLPLALLIYHGFPRKKEDWFEFLTEVE